MTKQEIFDLMSQNPAFFLATMDGNQPRVRGMLLYKADETGIIFHTGVMKDVYRQIMQNPQVELCFFDVKRHIQVRVSGKLELIDDNQLKDEISGHPTRQFLKSWRESGSLGDFYQSFAVFKLCRGRASTWTIEQNFAPKEEILL